MRVRIGQTAWLGGGTGAMGTARVYSAFGVALKTVTIASDAFGLYPGEVFVERERSRF